MRSKGERALSDHRSGRRHRRCRCRSRRSLWKHEGTMIRAIGGGAGRGLSVRAAPPCREREPEVMRIGSRFWAASRCKQSPAWGGLRRGAKFRALWCDRAVTKRFLLATTQMTIRHKCGSILDVWRRSAVPTTALTRADFFVNQAIDRVLNPVKSTKIHSHYAFVSPKHERCPIGQSTCVLLPRA
jgi:hypothetical protein